MGRLKINRVLSDCIGVGLFPVLVLFVLWVALLFAVVAGLSVVLEMVAKKIG